MLKTVRALDDNGFNLQGGNHSIPFHSMLLYEHVYRNFARRAVGGGNVEVQFDFLTFYNNKLPSNYLVFHMCLIHCETNS